MIFEILQPLSVFTSSFPHFHFRLELNKKDSVNFQLGCIFLNMLFI